MTSNDKSSFAVAVRLLGYTYMLEESIRPYNEGLALSLADYHTASELQHEASIVINTIRFFRDFAERAMGGELLSGHREGELQRLLEESYNR